MEFLSNKGVSKAVMCVTEEIDWQSCVDECPPPSLLFWCNGFSSWLSTANTLLQNKKRKLSRETEFGEYTTFMSDGKYHWVVKKLIETN